MSLQIEARDLAGMSLPGDLDEKEIKNLMEKANCLINELLAEAGRREPMSAFARGDIHECVRLLRLFDMHLASLLQNLLSGAALVAHWEQERDREGSEGEASEELAPPKVKVKKQKR